MRTGPSLHFLSASAFYMKFRLACTLTSIAILGGLATPAVLEAAPSQGRFILQTKRGISASQLARAAGGQVALELGSINAVAVYLPAAALAGLANNPNVTLLEEDAKRYPTAEVTPYGISMVQADAQGFYDHSLSSAVTVCVIDSGYAINHPDLLGNLNVTWDDDSRSGSALNDTCGHGTHVAGTIAAVGGNDEGVVGVNPSGELGLHIINVFGNDTDGGCAWSYSSSLVLALQRCEDAGARIVNMSLGGTQKSRTEEQAFNAANSRGVLSIAAAGNDGNTRLSYPASYSSVMSVAAIDIYEQVASFSQQNAQVEIAAPGVGVLSTVPWYSEASLTVNGAGYRSNMLEGAASTSASGVSGALVSGGLCTSGIPGAAGAVVLCQRGTNSFADKALNAQGSGAAAVVIYNNADGNFSGTVADSGVTIPGLSISKADGEALLAGGIGAIATAVAAFDPNGFGYEAWDGTSMATPHVAGVAALLLANAPAGTTTAEVRAAINQTAKDLGAAGRDVAYGYGLVQATAALNCLANKSTCLGGGSGGGGTGGGGGGGGGKGGGKPKLTPGAASE